MKSMCDEIEALRAELIDKQSLIDAYVRELAADED